VHAFVADALCDGGRPRLRVDAARPVARLSDDAYAEFGDVFRLRRPGVE
jgi:hypothetical protein